MATDLYTRPYFDACVWISWIKGEVINGIERAKIVTHLLQHAERKAFPIYTSTLTLAEVHKQRSSGMLTDDQDDLILAFFEHEYIHFIDVDRAIGEHANKLCRDKNIMSPGVRGLYPNDAVHLACALRANCDYLLTWDDGMLKCTHPDIKIEAPEMRGQAFLSIVPQVELK